MGSNRSGIASGLCEVIFITIYFSLNSSCVWVLVLFIFFFCNFSCWSSILLLCLLVKRILKLWYTGIYLMSVENFCFFHDYQQQTIFQSSAYILRCLLLDQCFWSWTYGECASFLNDILFIVARNSFSVILTRLLLIFILSYLLLWWIISFSCWELFHFQRMYLGWSSLELVV